MVKTSTFYETSPVDFTSQPGFVNSVVEVTTALSAEELLQRIGAIASLMNTLPKLGKGPRSIDLDILVFGDETRNSETLQLPHPRMCRRKFALVPLLEINPDAYCQVDKRPFRDCLSRIDDPTQTVEIYHG